MNRNRDGGLTDREHQRELVGVPVAFGEGTECAVRFVPVASAERDVAGGAVNLLLNVQNWTREDVFVRIGPDPLFQPAEVRVLEPTGDTRESLCDYLAQGPGKDIYAFLPSTRTDAPVAIGDESVFLVPCTFKMPEVGASFTVEVRLVGSIKLLAPAGRGQPTTTNLTGWVVLRGDGANVRVFTLSAR